MKQRGIKAKERPKRSKRQTRRRSRRRRRTHEIKHKIAVFLVTADGKISQRDEERG
jgi:hypothetical protein